MDDEWLPVRQIDAFTKIPSTGNAAGVVSLDAPLEDGRMRAIARELNLSETVFIMPDPVGEADVRLRYWTPTQEVPLCGHATVAALHHLAAGDDRDTWRLSTRVGVLEGRVADGVAWTTMDATRILGPWEGAWGDLLAVLGTDDKVLAEEATPMATADRLVALEVRDVETLDALGPDMRLLTALQEHGLEMLVLWARRGRSYSHDWHQRAFAPAWGIPEDPVTGLAAARMANLLASAGRLRDQEGGDLPETGTVRLKARQGDALSRRGIVHVALDRAEGGAVAQTRIGGHGVVALEGRIRVPPAGF